MDNETAQPKLYNIVAPSIPDEMFEEGDFCYADRAEAKDLITGPYRAKPDYSGTQPRWYDGSGLSWYSNHGPGFKVTYLTRRDIAQAAELIDDEFDLNFDHYRPSDYDAVGLGRTMVIQKCDSEYRVHVASELKAAIGDAYYISEADYQWAPVFTTGRVADFSSEEIASVLGATRPVHVKSRERSDEFLQWRTEGTSEEEAQYQALLDLLTSTYPDFRVVKVGEMDSGALDLYIFIRIPSGHLVGLKTITVET